MTSLQIFKNNLFEVAAKIENDQILFDVEQVAKSLGFTQRKGQKEYIRWETVNRYLEKYVSQQVGKGDLIPEPLVYKLAFKASNELAEKFQDWLAIEVIPQIRKTGKYEAPASELQVLQQTVNQLVKMDGRVSYLEDHMRIDGVQEKKLQSKGKSVAIESLGGIKTVAYKEISRKVFTAIWRDFKNHFEIPRYNELPRKQFSEAMKFLAMWQPSTSLRIEIQELNNQMSIQEVI
ncbi:ORF6C domain-containing protein [Cytobacillus sp. OWB-43]|uniref:ORF6C domain-containing protein n=1 Tax=Cytobacillus sp. OWB-43 TaxID=3108468 RepID=UPI002AFDD0B5|nr:ORF6C domain-containing protein [Cytobacillus sp. OWB-43]MEA1855622.1 ORF6C domain-containing protein [Cytobacillus sp. OWB-43]